MASMRLSDIMLGLKNILRQRVLSPFFTFSQKGNIWRMFFNQLGIVAGETRDIDSKNTYFFALDSVNGRELFREMQLEEKWWVSISGINSDTVFISGYKKPDMPEQLGITAVNQKDGSIRWTRNDLSFFYSNDQNVYAYKQFFESKKYLYVNAETGCDIGEVTPDDALSVKNQTESLLYKDFVYPEMLNGHNKLSGILGNMKYLGEVECIEFKNLLIFNIHEFKGVDIHDITRKNVTNRLFIRDSESNKIIFEETLNKNVSGYVPDSFFIRKDQLFYVKEKKELISIKLQC